MIPKALLLLTATLATGMAHATCYSIYRADGGLLQQSSTSPVDLTLQIGDTVKEKFGPGTTMTVSDVDIYCRDARERQQQPRTLADALREEEATRELAAKTGAERADRTKMAAK
jgi:hypothetical protein